MNKNANPTVTSLRDAMAIASAPQRFSSELLSSAWETLNRRVEMTGSAKVSDMARRIREEIDNRPATIKL